MISSINIQSSHLFSDLKSKLTEKQLQSLLKHFSPMISQERLQKIHSISLNRTEYITVVMEDIYQAHNASAVLRTADIFGIQNVHVIENRNYFQPTTGVTVGSDKWLDLFFSHKVLNIEEPLDIHRFSDVKYSQKYLQHLKALGFKIYGTTPHTDKTVNDIEINQPIALLFGSEQLGLSEEALEEVDEKVKIPMYGFSESFNISVSASLFLHTLIEKLRGSQINWGINPSEIEYLRLAWILKSIKNAQNILEHFKE